jgi:hypothetical protein
MGGEDLELVQVRDNGIGTAPRCFRERRLRGNPAYSLTARPDSSPPSADSDGTENLHEGSEWNACPCCGGRMVIIETFEPGCQPRLWPIPPIGLDSS